MTPRVRAVALAVALLLLAGRPTAAAQLPALRRVLQREGKRALATRLLRDADSHKRRSLRDVLDEHAGGRVRPAARDVDDDAVHVVQQPRSQTSDAPTPVDEPGTREQQQHGFVFRSVSQLFAWAINHTTASRMHNSTVSISLAAAAEEQFVPRERVAAHRAEHVARALPDLSAVAASERTLLEEEKVSAFSREGKMDHSPSEPDTQFREYSELDVLKDNIQVLKDGSRVAASRVVASLLQLEELCHSIDNGRDLHLSGGVEPLVHILSAPQYVVRANAAWALATCCQNNPTVQNASLQLGAVPTLVKMAANDDIPVVRARALFALNAILELEDARVVFERLPSSIHALRRSLSELEDVRATRRALNLAELLLTKNLDAWKTMLEAWDMPLLVERLMRQHRNADVRESAARTIAALDGKHVAKLTDSVTWLSHRLLGVWFVCTEMGATPPNSVEWCWLGTRTLRLVYNNNVYQRYTQCINSVILIRDLLKDAEQEVSNRYYNSQCVVESGDYADDGGLKGPRRSLAYMTHRARFVAYSGRRVPLGSADIWNLKWLAINCDLSIETSPPPPLAKRYIHPLI
ncbi:Armadillo-like helical domain containing protein [Gracilaria domingensis]|nr:Armadillo-like helical domain containing protein [Gracilaria domingensis]